MSLDDRGALLQMLHPDWVTMDIDKLGKSFYHSDDKPLSEPIRNLKVKGLYEALERQNLDILIPYLRSTEGVVLNELRMKIWPILLGINDSNDFENSTLLSGSTDSVKKLSSKTSNFFLEELQITDLPPHRDEDQVRLDIQRSATILSYITNSNLDLSNTSSHATGDESKSKKAKSRSKKPKRAKSKSITTSSLIEAHASRKHHQQPHHATDVETKRKVDEIKKKLNTLIIKLLRKHPALNYYQGYHDIASIVIIVCYNQDTQAIDDELAFEILEKLTLFHLRDFMIRDINLSVNHLRLIPKLLETCDSELFELIKTTNATYLVTEGELFDYKFYQAISSILTIFSHDLANIRQLLTIWDFIFSYGSILISVYIYASALMHFKNGIFEKLGLSVDSEFPDFDDVDKDIVHTELSPTKLFKNLSDESLIKILNQAELLVEKYPISQQHVASNEPDFEATAVETDNSFSSDLIDVAEEDFSQDSEEILESGDSNVEKIHLVHPWFKFNQHSVILTSSPICYKLEDRHENNEKYVELFDSDKLEAWIEIQDNEVLEQSTVEVQIQQEVLDKLQQQYSTSIPVSSESSGPILLSSSLSSLSTVASSSVLSTSALFKKLLTVGSRDDEKDSNSPEKKKRADSLLPANFYRISFTIGFVGFMIHFLLIKNTRLELAKYFSGHMDEFANVGNDIFRDVTNVVNNVFGNGIIGIGIGSIRSTIFGLP